MYTLKTVQKIIQFRNENAVIFWKPLGFLLNIHYR